MRWAGQAICMGEMSENKLFWNIWTEQLFRGTECRWNGNTASYEISAVTA